MPRRFRTTRRPDLIFSKQAGCPQNTRPGDRSASEFSILCTARMMSGLTRISFHAVGFATLPRHTRRARGEDGGHLAGQRPSSRSGSVPDINPNLVECSRRPLYRLAPAGESWLSVTADSRWTRLGGGPVARRW